MTQTQHALKDILADAVVFNDGDWVESKDQDPDGDVRLIQLADVGDGCYIDKSNRFMTSTKAKALRCTFLEPGDLLVARMPDPLGRCCVFPGDEKPCVTVVDVCVIRPSAAKVFPRWLMHCINAPIIRHRISGYVTGTTRQRISRGNLGKVTIPLPSLSEQKRIAEILDRAEALRAKRRAALALLDELTQSIFLDMFGDPVSNPKGWPMVALKDYFNFATGKLDSNAAVPGGKYPFFTCSRDDFQIDTFAFDCEALLLAGNNANADYSVKHFKGKFNAYQRTYVITLQDSENSYIYARISLQNKLAELKRISKGTGTKYLTLQLLNRITVPSPPPNLQREFEGKVNAVESQMQGFVKSQNELNQLFASLQHRAFRGEL